MKTCSNCIVLFADYPALQELLVHKTFLEELVFWTVKFEFPQKVVCLLLNMLPDPDYKVQLFLLYGFYPKGSSEMAIFILFSRVFQTTWPVPLAWN